MNALDFETKWQTKIVRPTAYGLAVYSWLPNKEYKVTASLLDWEDDGKTTIFAVLALDYNLDNKHWFTFHFTQDQVAALDTIFEII